MFKYTASVIHRRKYLFGAAFVRHERFRLRGSVAYPTQSLLFAGQAPATKDPGSQKVDPKDLEHAESLRSLPHESVQHNFQAQVLCIRGILVHAASSDSVHRASLLFQLGRRAEKHPELRKELQSGCLRAPLQSVFQAEVVRGDRFFEHKVAVSQAAMAQVHLSFHHAPFWEGLQVRHVQRWSKQMMPRRQGEVVSDEQYGRTPANVLYAYGKLFDDGVIKLSADKRLREVFIAAMVHSAHIMGCRAISMSCWSLGKQHISFADALPHIVRAVDRTASTMSAQDVSNTFLGFSECGEHLGESAVPLIERLVQINETQSRGVGERGMVKPQNVSIAISSYGTLHSFGKAASVSPELQYGLVDAVRSCCMEFSAVELGFCVSGLGRLRWKHGAAAAHIRAAVDANVPSMTAQGIVMNLNGFQQSGEQLGDSAPRLMEHFARLVAEQEEVSPQLVSQSVLRYGQLHSMGKAAALTAKLQQEILHCIRQYAAMFSVDQLVRCIYGLGKLQWEFGGALGPLQEAVESTASKMNAKQVANTFWGFASCGEPLGESALPLIRQLLEMRNAGREDEKMVPKAVPAVVGAYGQLYCLNNAPSVSQQFQDELIDAVQSFCMQFIEKDLSYCVSGLGKLRWKHGAAAERIRAAVDAKVSMMPGKGIAQNLQGFAESSEDLGDSAPRLIERLLSLIAGQEEVSPRSVAQSVRAYGVLHSTSRAPDLSAKVQQDVLDCIRHNAAVFSVGELVWCIFGLGKLRWQFGAALGPMQEAVAIAADKMSREAIEKILNGFHNSGEPLGVALDAIKERQCELELGQEYAEKERESSCDS